MYLFWNVSILALPVEKGGLYSAQICKNDAANRKYRLCRRIFVDMAGDSKIPTCVDFRTAPAKVIRS